MIFKFKNYFFVAEEDLGLDGFGAICLLGVSFSTGGLPAANYVYG